MEKRIFGELRMRKPFNSLMQHVLHQFFALFTMLCVVKDASQPTLDEE
jgi:hypothetical protein